ncbi:KdsC family phosphatase [Chitinivibrio alkaliphilus]|uniref:YrbI family 3-deoxy-D-manno-octulosonate 8-phosphate phosphatase n=1 Tax=Chitinivibrio alkaliphilus ACht1 TaxID=1313304 RepID=U7DC74_9BACT|nr:HAD-IIIA family hydrolase [Chitinivibrio alkaliphilus]ERP39178.1 YrbI family 3-deoxy-D-manno-octulosonate 8-phosphate phosphatase [Chitinivibrio alkaliphilus ACht1]
MICSMETLRHIVLVATDIDGVWTDGSMYYGSSGEEMKRFSTYDGMAVARLREHGLHCAVLTGENSSAVHGRMKKLGIVHYYPGEKEKLLRMRSICKDLRISLDQVAYIGDDLNDLALLQAVGCAAMPHTSPIQNIFTPHYTTRCGGGAGAFREFTDYLLSFRSRG